MTGGRGSAAAAAGSMVGFLALALAFHSLPLLASAAILTVGGSQGWNINVDYTAWAAGQTFAAGDILFFPYEAGAHNVAEVDKAGYDACSASGATTHTEGNTNVTLSTGTSYYLCSFPSHCSLGMKLAVTVGASATSPVPPPSTSVGTPPPTKAPSVPPPSTSVGTPPPTKAPSAPPARAPSAPGLTPVPSVRAPASASAPAPAPASAPASAPTPITPTPAAAPTSTPTPGALVPSSTSAGTPSSATGSPPPPNIAPRIASTASLATALLLSAAVLAVL